MSKITARLTKEEKSKATDNEKLIWYYRQFPVMAAKDLLGIDLVWYQREALNDMFFKLYVLLLFGRGIGKTFLLALFASLYAILYPKTKIGIIAPVFRQASYLFDHIEEFHDSSPYFRACVRKSNTKSKGLHRTYQKELIRFKNGSFIEALPLGDGNKVRGRRYNVILADEYAQIDEDIINLVVRPMMNIRKADISNKLIISSSAYYPWNHLYIQYLMYKVMESRQPDLYAVHEYYYEDLLRIPDAPYKLDEDSMNMQRAVMTEEEFDMEHRAKFPIESKGFFPARLLESCTSKGDSGVNIEIEAFNTQNQYVMGIDSARIAGGDNFAISIIKMGENLSRTLVYAKTLNGASYQQMRDTIRMTLSRFPVIRLTMDAAGGGTTIKDLLAEPWMDPLTGKVCPPIFDMDDDTIPPEVSGLRMLEMVNFTTPVINDMYNRLKADMQHNRFYFPVDIRRHPDQELEKAGWDIIATKQELMLLQVEPSGNMFKFVVPEHKKKDRATALALANYGVNNILSAPVVPEVDYPVGFWV